jgi:hypothetical protein
MNPQKPPKPPMKLLPTGGSPLQRLAIFGGGLVVLIILIAIVAGMLGKSGQAGTNDIIAVAQEQTELARIAADAGDNATALATQNLAHNLELTMTSAQSQTVDYLAQNGHKLGSKTLGLKHSAGTDTTLQNAHDAGTYDSTFVSLVQTQIAAYEQSLRTAYNAKPGPKGEAMLNSQYQAAKLLDTQSHQQ